MFSWFFERAHSLVPTTSMPVMRSSLTSDHLHIATLCRDVYEKDTESLDSFVQSKDTGIQASVTSDGKRAIVCFRGTNQPRDWLLNLNLGKVPFLSRKHTDDDIEVHSGFFVGHNSVKAKIYSKLNTLVESGECDHILFCGHSLGSALCVLSAFDYVNERNIPIDVVTFGSPRIGNIPFIENFNENIQCMRIVNDRDIVSIAPLKLMGFHHVGDVVHLKETGTLTEETGFFKRLSWRIQGAFDVDFGVRDHDMSSYIEQIEKHLIREL